MDTAVGLVNLVLIRHRNEMRFCINQLIQLNNQILQKLPLSEAHHRKLKRIEMLASTLSVVCFLVPLAISILVVCPMEPCHIIIQEWFDIDISFEPRFIPFFILTFTGFYNCTNTVHVFACLLLFYHSVATTCLDDIIISGTTTPNGRHCLVKTKSWNIVEDTEVIRLYRVLQYFQILFNNIFSHILVAFHHVGFLVCTAVLMFFIIKYQHVVAELGIFANIVIIALASVPVISVSMQSSMCEEVVGVSNRFRSLGLRRTKRRTVINKFLKSCNTFYLKLTHPFYSMHKDTFLLFMNQVLDSIITLLLW